MGTDYYKVLGVEKDADEDAIKRAYKSMALKWHPDRNKGSEQANKKFKEVCSTHPQRCWDMALKSYFADIGGL